MCCSLVIVLLIVYCLCLMVLFFHQCFLCFLEGLLGCMRFLHLEDDMLRGYLLLFFQFSYRNLVRIRQEFRNIVFCRVDFYIYMLVMFLDKF